MPPSALIDSDLSGATLWVLEAAALWKGEGAGGGAATWAQVLDAATFATDLPGLVFGRVRAAGATIYVAGGTSDGDAVVIVSLNGGATWNWYLVEAAALTVRPYTVKQKTTLYSHTADLSVAPFSVEIPREADAGNDESPWALAYTWHASQGGSPAWPHPNGWAATIEAIDGGADTYNATARGINPRIDGVSPIVPVGMLNNALDIVERAVAESYLNDYFGSFYPIIAYPSEPEMPKSDTRTKITFIPGGTGYGWPNGETATWVATGYVFYNIPETQIPMALDYAPSNPLWVYLATGSKIYKSTNGGAAWEILLEDEGANDLCVDPQLAGVVYAWRTGGSLHLIVNGAVNATLDTETPVEMPLRLARDPQSGRLWALNGGTTLRMRNLGSWSDQQTDLVNARGLHAYLGGKLIFVDGTDIYTSDDYGATVTAKKGGWSEYGSGVNSHRIKPA